MSESRPHGCLRVCFALCLLLLCGGQAKAGQATLPDEFLAVQRFALTVQTDPADATVKVLNIGPKYHDGILLEPGRYTVQVSRPGYVTKTLEVIIVDQDLKWGVSLALAPAPEPVVPAPEPAAPPAAAPEPSPTDPHPAVEPGPAQPPQAVADAVSSPADFEAGVQEDVAQARYDQLLPDADLILRPGDDLKKMLALAKEGALVLLEPGTYLVSGKLDIKKGLHLVGPGPDKAEILADQIFIDTKHGAIFEIDGVALSPSRDKDLEILSVEDSFITLKNCRVENSNRSGILATSTTVDISYCDFLNNKYAGLAMRNSSYGTISHNKISQNNVGIVISTVSSINIINNLIKNNEQCGIAAFEKATGEYNNNLFYANKMYGLAVFKNANPTVNNNQFSENGETSLILYDSGNGIYKNNFFGKSKEKGISIAVDNTSSGKFSGNTVDGKVLGISEY